MNKETQKNVEKLFYFFPLFKRCLTNLRYPLPGDPSDVGKDLHSEFEDEPGTVEDALGRMRGRGEGGMNRCEASGFNRRDEL
jgi:hypothetical protein